LKVFFKHIILFVFFTSITIYSFSQQYNFRGYSVDEGLAQSQVYDIKNDIYGNLWVGTDGGLCKFNGYEFENFTQLNGLLNNRIRSLFIDNKTNNVYIGLYGGLSIYDGKKFKNYPIDQNKKGDVIISILKDISGILWIGTDQGLKKFINGKFEVFDKYSLLQNVPIYDIESDKYGNIWFCTGGNGLIKFDGKNYSSVDNYYKNKKINDYSHIYKDKLDNIWFISDKAIFKYNGKKIINISEYLNLKISNYTTIIQDKSFNYWVGTNGNGLVQFNNKNQVYYNQSNGLAINYISCLIEDKTNQIWCGTDGGGICKFSGEHFIHYSEKDGLPNNLIMAISEDSRGNFWFGTFGAGLSKFDGKSFKNFTTKDGLSSNIVYSIVEDNNKNIWIGLKDGGVSMYNYTKFTNYTTKNGLISDLVYSIIVDNKNNIWIGTNKGINTFDGKKFNKITTDEGLSSNQITVLYKDNDNNIWAGTNGGGVNKLKVNEKSIEIESFISPDNGLSDNYVLSIVEDNNKNILLGTYGGGLNIFDGKKFHNYTTGDGLKSNNVYFICVDNENVIWLGSEKGIDKVIINQKTFKIKSIKHYDKQNGLIGTETNRNAVYLDNVGKIWFGTINGVTRYEKTLDIVNSFEPVLYINNIKLFNENIDWTKYSKKTEKITHLPIDLVLPYNKNHITIKFTGVNLIAPEKVKYKWMLEGLDETWLPETEKREAVYSYLPPGDYIFRLIACNNDNVWTKKELRFAFTIKPPFYLTWWFYVILSIFLSIVIFIYIRIRLYSLKQEKEVLETKVKWKTRQLEIEKENIELQKEQLSIQAEQLVKANKELKKLSVVVRETGNAVIIANNNGDIEWINDGFEKLYGYKYSEFRKKFGNNIMQTARNTDIEEYIQKAIETKKSTIFSSNFINRENKNKWVQTVLTPIFGKDGSLINLVLIESDITKLKDAEQEIFKQKEELENEKKKTDSLLLNILPSETADELKKLGKSTARYYELATVMFTDFKGFTLVAQEMTPEKLVQQLHSYFSLFDDIIENHNIEKIKTIGDAYMCAGGVPIRSKSNPIDVILAALEINEYLRLENIRKQEAGEPFWELRIGIHTGAVIAGVVGKKKFAYDIWGDTVNTTSRIESCGESGKVNISGATYEYVKDYFDCEYRGKVNAKHKGMIDMYFVNGIKKEFCDDEKRITPNKKLLTILSKL